ncbi:MAG: nucleotidyltransferase family protein [Gammaproteobacteria bacterium]
MKRKKAQLIALAAAHGARNSRVFGSVVRGGDSAESDVDLLVEMDEERSL